MKKLLTLFLILLGNIAFAQDIQKLQTEIEALKNRVAALEQIVASHSDSSTAPVSSTTSEAKRCIAITNAGTQCKRNADPGSDYCWQHKRMYEPIKSSTVNSSSSNTSTQNSISTGTTSSGRTIYTGPRGGKYYINSNGNKTYIKKK